MGVTGIHHVQLAMPRGRENDARAFYRDVLGMEEQAKPESLAGRGGVWFSSGDVQVHLGVEDGFRPARKAHPALRVVDLPALIERCRNAGHAVVTEEALPGCERAYVADPFGNRIELIEDPTSPAEGGSPALESEIFRLIDQSVWANGRWVEFVYSFPDPDLRPRELLGHIWAGERIWLDRVFERPEKQAPFPVRAAEELLRGFEQNRETLRKLTETRREEIVDFTRATGEKYHARVVDVVFMLLTHGYHHRGQLATHYARKGMSYPRTDHVDFLIQNRL